MYIPGGSKIKFTLKSDGNLFNISNYDNTISMALKRDLYFYRPSKYKASISFDNKNWGLNIMAFDVGFEQESRVKNGLLLYDYLIIAGYKG